MVSDTQAKVYIKYVAVIYGYIWWRFTVSAIVGKTMQ